MVYPTLRPRDADEGSRIAGRFRSPGPQRRDLPLEPIAHIGPKSNMLLASTRLDSHEMNEANPFKTIARILREHS